MTDKELHRLSRRDILQLMLTQGKETEELRQVKTELEQQLEELTHNYERLKKRLDYKDEQIHQLQDTLQKERTNRRIELDEAGSIAEASLRLNGLFETAQKAADQYLYNIRRLYLKNLKESSSIKEEKQSPDSVETAEEYRKEEPVTIIKEQGEVPKAVSEGEEQNSVVESVADEEGKDRVPEATEEQHDKEPEPMSKKEEQTKDFEVVLEEEKQNEELEAVAEEEKRDEAPEAAAEDEKHEEASEGSEEEEGHNEALEVVVENEKHDEVPEAVNSEELTVKRKFSIFRRKKAI